MRRSGLFACLIGLLLALPCGAAKVKVWHQYTQAHFEKAKFQHATVTSEGVLRLARQLRPLAPLDAANVWALAEDLQGNLYAATGDEGKLYRIAPDGKVSMAYRAEDSQILSLASGPDGAIYAGTGPGGTIVRLAPGGDAEVVARGLGTYVWSLAYDANAKTLFAGTGPKGRIYRLKSGGKAEVLYDTRQEHILCLGLGEKGMLYAGTDKGGLVYRIDPTTGKAFVLVHASQPEVRCLLVTPEALYAGTSAPVARKGSGFLGKATGPEPAPSASDNSLYRIAADGTMRELFRDKTLMLSLLRQDGRILVGTGMQGQLFEVDEATKERSELARLDHGSIHSLLQRKDGSIVIGAGDPGKLYTLSHRFTAKGTVLSEVLDAKLPSRWGALNWQADTPAGTHVTIAVRAGNVAEPDATWSDWSREEADPHTAHAHTPVARYCQYRVTLTSDNTSVTPTLRNFSLRYQTSNQAPDITSLDVPDLSTANLDNPRKLKIRWTATDPNDDELSYSLYFRKDGWRDWLLLEENIEKKEYEWDTTGVPSGQYQLKVVASDRRDNVPEEALTAERSSATVPITQIPPTVTVKIASVEGDRLIVDASASDPYVRLTDAAYAINGKRWTNVFPIDGLFDGKAETFRFRTDPLRPGSYVLVLRVRDAAGNVGSGDVVFRVPGAK
jgi:outer membrane protein assembly factor BamB